MEKPRDIYQYVTQEENRYTLPVSLMDGYDWGMREHINTSVMYKNSQFTTGKDLNKPFKNIIRPIIKLQYRKEGFDVKDIGLFIDDSKKYYKTLLLRKFHEKWARANGMDTFIDDIVESYVDFGGVLTKKTSEIRPEVVQLQSIAFCDQTDILSGPIGIKHQFSPDQLLEMKKVGWGDTNNGATISIEELIRLANDVKVIDKNKAKQITTPGKYITVYEIHGTMPKEYLLNENDEEQEDYVSQMQIVAFYHKENGEKEGVTLFRAEEIKSPFKFLAREKIFGRALGFGGIEELFEAQVWTNYSEIQKKALLDAATKIIFQTDDPAFANRNNVNDLENGEILVTADGKNVRQLDTFPRNIQLFDNSINEWEVHGKVSGNANDAITGKSPTSGTPFKLQELVTEQAEGEHTFKRGQISTFLDEIYRDWIIPQMTKEITKGTKFLSELELDELQSVADSLVLGKVHEMEKELVLNGEEIKPEEIEIFKEKIRADFMKGGNKRFVEILKDEFKKTPFDVYTNIKGKQKDIANRVDKLVNVFRQLFSTFNPQTGTFTALDDPRMAKLFNEIITSSGLSPIDFTQKPIVSPIQAQTSVQGTQPLKELSNNIKENE